MSHLSTWSRDQLDALGDRAAEDGEHAVVAAYQTAVSSYATERERSEALAVLRAYADEAAS